MNLIGTAQGKARWRINLARLLALAADAVQLVLIPVFSPGALSPFEDLLDGGMAVAMTALLGWNWAFLPAFLLEMVPGVDLAPTWTIAAFLATKGVKALPGEGQVIEGEKVERGKVE